MPFDELVFPTAPSRSVELNGTTHTLKPYQAVVWLSVRPIIQDLPIEERNSCGNSPLVPAILDTGCNSTLSIRESQLSPLLNANDWRFNQNKPREVRDASGEVNLVPRLIADVWLRSKNPQNGSAAEYRLPLANEGINFFPSGPPILGKHIDPFAWKRFVNRRKGECGLEPQLKPVAGPHIPILGLGALCRGNTKIEFLCEPSVLTVRLFVPN